MATVSVINTTDLKLYSDGNVIAHAREAQLTMTHTPRDITSKDSGGWRRLLEGLRTGSFSGNSLMAYDAAYGVADLWDLLYNRTKSVLKFGTDETGDLYFQGTGYLTELSPSSPAYEDNAQFNWAFELDGAPTTGTNA